MAADTDANNNNDVWFMERVCVELKSDNRHAVIKEINADKTAVVELEDKSTQTVRVDEVSRVNPKEKDMVLVIGGADVGVEGDGIGRPHYRVLHSAGCVEQFDRRTGVRGSLA